MEPPPLVHGVRPPPAPAAAAAPSGSGAAVTVTTGTSLPWGTMGTGASGVISGHTAPMPPPSFIPAAQLSHANWSSARETSGAAYPPGAPEWGAGTLLSMPFPLLPERSVSGGAHSAASTSGGLGVGAGTTASAAVAAATAAAVAAAAPRSLPGSATGAGGGGTGPSPLVHAVPRSDGRVHGHAGACGSKPDTVSGIMHEAAAQAGALSGRMLTQLAAALQHDASVAPRVRHALQVLRPAQGGAGGGGCTQRDVRAWVAHCVMAMAVLRGAWLPGADAETLVDAYKSAALRAATQLHDAGKTDDDDRSLREYRAHASVCAVSTGVFLQRGGADGRAPMQLSPMGLAAPEPVHVAQARAIAAAVQDRWTMLPQATVWATLEHVLGISCVATSSPGLGVAFQLSHPDSDVARAVSTLQSVPFQACLAETMPVPDYVREDLQALLAVRAHTGVVTGAAAGDALDDGDGSTYDGSMDGSDSGNSDDFHFDE